MMPLLLITPRQRPQKKAAISVVQRILAGRDKYEAGSFESILYFSGLPLALLPSNIETVAADKDPWTEVP